MRQDSNKKAEFDAITEFNSLVESIHPSEILQGVNACSLLGQKLKAADLLNPSIFPLDLALKLQASMYRGGLYSDSEQFQANLKTYAQVLWGVEQTLWECTYKLPENLTEPDDFEIFGACEDAIGHISRISKGLGFDVNVDTAQAMISASWRDPVIAFLQRCPTEANVLSHWSSAQKEEPPEPKPLKERQTVAVPSFARAFNWRDALACVVAVSGAVLLEYICGPQPAWKHFAALLALLMVAAPVWKVATRYAKRSALVPIAQPKGTA